MLFPTLAGKPFCYINFGSYARDWRVSHFNTMLGPSPLNDPEVCAKMIADAHFDHSVFWSYGGLYEDRRYLWAGNYLEKNKTFHHLGIDYNVSAGTPIASDNTGIVLRVGDDSPEPGGWGGHVVVEIPHRQAVLIYAHLDRSSISLKPGDFLDRDARFAVIGTSKQNGGWYSHTHIQAMAKQTWEDTVQHFDTLDGYGQQHELSDLAAKFWDPSRFVHLW